MQTIMSFRELPASSLASFCFDSRFLLKGVNLLFLRVKERGRKSVYHLSETPGLGMMMSVGRSVGVFDRQEVCGRLGDSHSDCGVGG